MDDLSYFNACDSFKNPNHWLAFYYLHFGTFKVATLQVNKLGRKFSTKWRHYGSTDYAKFYDDKDIQPNNRSIFDTEVVIDIDVKDRIENKIITKHIITRLRKLEVSYSVWKSGSKCGTHIHCFFPELRDYNPDIRVLIKQFIIRYYCGDYYCLDTSKIDLSSSRKDRLIACECSLHRSGYSKKKVVGYYYNGFINHIPKKVLDKVFKPKESHIREFSPIKSIPETGTKKPYCISYLESANFKGRRDFVRRGCWILANYYKNLMDYQTLRSYLINWRDTCVFDKAQVNDSTIDDCIRYSKGKMSHQTRHIWINEFLPEVCYDCEKSLR